MTDKITNTHCRVIIAQELLHTAVGMTACECDYRIEKSGLTMSGILFRKLVNHCKLLGPR